MGSDRDNDGAYLIDRSPIFFEHILNYLRTNKLIYETRSQLQGIQLEAEFYNLQVSSIWYPGSCSWIHDPRLNLDLKRHNIMVFNTSELNLEFDENLQRDFK